METEINNNRRFVNIISRIVKLFGGRIVIGLTFIIGFLLFFGWLAEEVFEGETKNFDESVRDYIHGFATPTLTTLMKFFSFLGSPLFLVIIGIIVIVTFIYLKYKRSLVIFLITMAGELAIDLALKPFFGRVRPAAYFDYPLPLSFSFPSGHAFGSLCFYGMLAWFAISNTKNKAAKISIGFLAFISIFFIGLSRIYLGVHYPSDVLAGYAAGLFWVGIVALTDSHLRQRNKN
jgi:undecaprenyl-diphosphatase